MSACAPCVCAPCVCVVVQAGEHMQKELARRAAEKEAERAKILETHGRETHRRLELVLKEAESVVCSKVGDLLIARTISHNLAPPRATSRLLAPSLTLARPL